MSKVKDFVFNAPTAVLRTPRYPVNPANLPAKANGQPYWTSTTAEVRSLVEMPRTYPLAGQSLSDQVRSAFTNYYRYIAKIPSRKSLDRQVSQVSLYYQELRNLGFDIQDVTNFRLKHAKALVAKWQSNKCASTTVYSRWSNLRTWSRVLGKHEMLPNLKDVQPGFSRYSEPSNGNGKSYRVLTVDQVLFRSNYLESKADLTVFFVDRLCRELELTREEALQLDLDAVKAVVEGKATALRIGMGNQRTNIPQDRLNLLLLARTRDFMVSRNRKALAWSHLDLDAALQKYTLRLSYVTRTLFPEKTPGGQTTTKESGAV